MKPNMIVERPTGILADYTTNRTLEDEAERLHIPLHFCWHKTSFTKPKKNGGYIINLAPQGKPGTHWTALWKDRDQIAYFDPFGFPPPEEIEDRIGKYYYNEKVIQDPQEGLCGGYCIAFLEFMNESKGLRAKRLDLSALCARNRSLALGSPPCRKAALWLAYI